MAPGYQIYSCWDSPTVYGILDGTSMASPLVSSLAGLILSRFPFVPAEGIESCIENTCVNIDGLNQYPIYSNGIYPYEDMNNQPHNLYQYNLGHGRIDALAAINCIQSNIGQIGVLPNEPCPDQPVNLFYYSNIEILSYNWTVTPAPQSINSTTISNPEIVFGNLGQYTITLDVVPTSGSPFQETKIFNVTNQPTAQISSINNLNQTCDGSSQSIFVQFTGHPPFSITLTDGSQNYTFNNLLQYQSTVYLDVKFDYNTISVVSVSDLYCTNNNGNSITFNNIVKCCPNKVVNGDFDNGNTGFFTDYYLGYGQNYVTTAQSYYGLYHSVIPQHSNSFLLCDGLCNACTPPPQVPNPMVWRSQSISVNPNQNYYFSFWITNARNEQTTSGYFLGWDQTPAIQLLLNGQPVTFNNLNNPTNIFYANVQPDRYMHLCGIWNSHNNTNLTMELFDPVTESVWGNDFGIDNIELRCIEDFQIVASNDISICSGQSTNISVISHSGGLAQYQYLWSNNGGNTQAVTVNPTVTTNYTVTVTDANGCTATDDVLVTVFPQTNANAGPDITICHNTSITLTASGGINYLWSTNENTASITVNPAITQTYTVTVTDANGCTDTDDVIVNIDNECDCEGVQITTFTWNNTTPLINGQSYYLHGITNVNIPSGTNAVITDNAISIDPNLNITIANGSSLTINHCHLYACNNMWQGIIVSPGGRLIINDINSTGTTLIEDAIISVDLTNPNSSTEIKVDNAVFNKNLNAVKIANYQSNTVPSPYSNFVIKNSVFTSRNINNCTPVFWPSVASLKTLLNSGTPSEKYAIGGYSVTGLNNPALDPPNSGIILENVGTLSSPDYYEVLIDGYNTTGTNNIFDNLLYGIDATNSNFTCQNNVFQNITGGYNFTDGIGIRARNTNLPFTSLNRIVVNGGNNYFYDNKIGIDILNYDVVNINNTDMRSDHGTLEGVIGIQIQTPQCTEIDVTDNIITNVLYGILFAATDLSQNIHGPFNINYNTIQADINGYDSFQAGENVTIGIVVNAMNSSTPVNQDCNQLNVIGNRLYDVRNGIQMANWIYFYSAFTPEYIYCLGNRPVITNNYVTLVDPENPTYNSQYGICTSLNWNGIIKDNLITGFSNSELGYYGIMCLENTNYTGTGGQAHGQVVECNKVMNNGIGIGFYSPQNDGTRFMNNTMEGSQIGLAICDNGKLGQQGYTPSYASNNEWPYNTYVLGQQYKTYVVNSDAHNSVLVIDGSNNNQNPEFGGTSFNWGNPYSFNTVFKSATGSLISISPNPNTNIPDCDQPQIGSKSGNSGNNTANTEEGNLKKQIKKLEKMLVDSANYTYFPEQQHINDLFNIYKIIELNPTIKDSSVVIKNFHNAAKNRNIGAINNIENMLTNGLLQHASSALLGIVPQNNIETNFMNFYKVYIHYKNNSFTIADSIMLKNLVDGCPVRDGSAVRKARTLYCMIYKDFTLYPDNCNNNDTKKTGVDNNKATQINANLSMEVYPNPNNGTFTISLNGSSSISGSAEVIVYDILGNQIKTVNLYLRNNIAIFDTELSNGIYFISVKDSKGNVYNPKKIIVIK